MLATESRTLDVRLRVVSQLVVEGLEMGGLIVADDDVEHRADGAKGDGRHEPEILVPGEVFLVIEYPHQADDEGQGKERQERYGRRGYHGGVDVGIGVDDDGVAHIIQHSYHGKGYDDIHGVVLLEVERQHKADQTGQEG